MFIGSTTAVLIPISWVSLLRKLTRDNANKPQGGVMYSWSSWRTLVPLIVGLVGLVAFVPYEMYYAKEPMVRFSIFEKWTQKALYFQTFIHGIVLWSLLY